MKGEYWFNSEPISKYIAIFFEYEEYDFLSEVIHLCSIDELKEIIDMIHKHMEDTRAHFFVREYFRIKAMFGYCYIDYELPKQSYSCMITCPTMAELLEKYVYKYEHFDDRFKDLKKIDSNK